jgi:signal transduction histidine kinase/DNA-binding NarL/FixJ family response regulator
MSGEHLRVLLIDPDVLERDRITRLLEREVALTTVSRLADALAHVAQQTFDLALIAAMLAEGPAAEAVVRLHRVSARLPILVMSEDVEDAPARAALRAGAQDAVPRRRAGADVLLRAKRFALERRRAEESTERFLREVGARTQAEAAERRARLLADAASIASGSLELDEMLDALARWIVPRLADACVIELASSFALRRRPPVIRADDPRAESALHTALRRDDTPDSYLSLIEIATGPEPSLVEIESVLLRNATTPEHVRSIGDANLGSCIVVPLVARNRTLGAITLIAFGDSREFTRDDLETAHSLSRQVALGVDNARLYEEARQAVRAREEVLAIVSHDLRNPLNVIFTGVSLLRRTSHGSDPKLDRQLERMHRAAERMNHLIRDLLDVARIEGGRLTVEIGRQDAAQIVMEISDLLRPLAHERGIALVGRTEESLPPVACDRERTLQVLSNFIGNALKFTPAGGQITVTAEQDVAGVRFSVRDTGTGIQRADQARIFDRFWQGDRAGRDGAGLGLAISKGIVEAHGGRIGVESEPGAGATFWFTLRVAASSGGHEGSRANGA